jgi:hypothetical protein
VVAGNDGVDDDDDDDDDGEMQEPVPVSMLCKSEK